jgi:hypothetical protein
VVSSTIFAAPLNGTATKTYQVTLNSNGASLDGYTTSIGISNISTPFSVTQNTCDDITFNQSCNITIVYSPTSNADFDVSQSINFVTSDNQYSTSLAISGVPNIVTADMQVFTTSDGYPKETIEIKIPGNSLGYATAQIDTGSSTLFMKESYLAGTNYIPTGQIVTADFGEDRSLSGQLVYVNVEVNSSPIVITATNVPVVMVADNAFIDNGFDPNLDAIVGSEMNNQISLWRYFSYPYSEMLVFDKPQFKLFIGDLSDSEIENDFGYYQLSEDNSSCINNDIVILAPYNQLPCWLTNKIDITYTFDNGSGQIDTRTYHTIFDTGSEDTEFALSPIPSFLSDNTINGTYQGTVTSANLQTANNGSMSIATTSTVKVSDSSDNNVLSGFEMFNNKKILFDYKNGLVGIAK